MHLWLVYFVDCLGCYKSLESNCSDQVWRPNIQRGQLRVELALHRTTLLYILLNQIFIELESGPLFSTAFTWCNSRSKMRIWLLLQCVSTITNGSWKHLCATSLATRSSTQYCFVYIFSLRKTLWYVSISSSPYFCSCISCFGYIKTGLLLYNQTFRGILRVHQF